jgi:tetratricopeptide (TPR) repeat protein
MKPIWLGLPMAAVIVVALSFSPHGLSGRAAAEGGGPSPSTPPPADTKKPSEKKATKSKKKTSALSDEQFIAGYKDAYAMIYDHGQYQDAIAKLRSLGHDDHADVANLIGYSHRKLGNMAEAKRWYEAALKADPNHVRTWQYYGLWQLETRNYSRAEMHLAKIGELCGKTCPEYLSLEDALERAPSSGISY